MTTVRTRIDPHPTARAAIQAKPAVTIWGALDRTLHAEPVVPFFAQLFPSAPVQLLPGASHCSPEDAPHEIARLVNDFLSETSKAENMT